MNKISFIIGTITILFSLSGCEKDMQSFEGQRGIYFSVRWGDNWVESIWPYWSYSIFDFANVSSDTTTATAKVMLTDVTVPYDRTFKYKINAEATTAEEGVDYEIPEGIGIIPAGKVEGYATVILYRTAKMEKEIVTVALQLVANENFDLVFTKFVQPSNYTGSSEEIEKEFDASKHEIRIQDVLVKPDTWYGGFYQYGNYEEFNLLGAFSTKKIRLLFELYDLTYADFLDSSIMTYGYETVLSRRFSEYLTGQYRNGTPILENDGRLMWAGSCKWKSYENVPWNGTINPEYF
ncbi:MAG TPA: hypothetical protein DEF88_01905 [Porphyromonadaceae bacterium]|jgi:hypothetical protein|nr:hypothetical protein [Porphyromonadaceae bacterium]HBX19190.1 hypothetical protein [Porphyromonadaceae bacterium]HCM19955.1 hypothetical protein [Porphyromonadaceae bacterium]